MLQTSSSFNTNANTSTTSSFGYKNSTSYRSYSSSMSNRRPTSSKISFRNKFFRIGLKRKNTDTGQPRYERFFDNEDLPWELIKNNRSCTVFPSSSTSLTSHNTLNFKGSGRESFEIQLSPNDFIDYDSTGTGCLMGQKHYYMALRKNKVNLKDKSKKKKLNKQLTKSLKLRKLK